MTILYRDFKLVPRKWDVWSSFFVPFPSSATSFNPSETMPPSFDYIQQRVLGTYTPSYLSAMDSETGSEYESPLFDSDDEHDHGDGESFSSHVESSTSSGSTYICIPTDYDPKHKDNLRAPYPPTQEGRDQWSYQQRACAALAYEPKNIDDLKARVSYLNSFDLCDYLTLLYSCRDAMMRADLSCQVRTYCSTRTVE